jgi:hypothetical protein
MNRLLVTAAALAAVAAATAGPLGTPGAAARGSSPGCDLPRFGPGATYHPVIRPATFSARITNPWFPLRPGTTYVYAGIEGGERAVDVVTVSRATRVVDRVRARVVQDRLFHGNTLEERTADYYAQDRCGNVWYVGEDTAELDAAGHVVDTEGTWHAGVAGAQPGVFMQARPQLNRHFRQEWLAGEAEDVFRAISKRARVRVPYGSFGRALETAETSALEPGTLDHKYYVRGVGDVLEVTVRGGRERLALVAVLR